MEAELGGGGGGEGDTARASRQPPRGSQALRVLSLMEEKGALLYWHELNGCFFGNKNHSCLTSNCNKFEAGQLTKSELQGKNGTDSSVTIM